MDKGFDIYSCIQNDEIRDFFRKNHIFTLYEQVQIVLHSYESVENKRNNLSQLSDAFSGDDKAKIEEMVRLLDICIKQINNPGKKVLYVSTFFPDENQFEEKREFPADIEFYDSMEQLKKNIHKYYQPTTDLNQRIYVYQVIFEVNKPHEVFLEFEMTWIDEILQVSRLFPDRQWLRSKGISENTIDSFEDIGLCHKQLPFKDGCKIKIKTPIMKNSILGTIHSECDDFGCWYYFLTTDKGEEIDLSYHEFDLVSGYVVFDWIERM